MKIIDVYGDDDYAAMFIEDEYGVQKAYEEAKANGGHIEIKGDDYQQAYVEIFEFGEVDPEFISYIRLSQDYDMSKHSNFYIIEEVME